MHLCLTQGHRYIGAMYDIVTYTISAIGTKSITKGHRDIYRIYMKYKCIHILWQYCFHHMRWSTQRRLRTKVRDDNSRPRGKKEEVCILVEGRGKENEEYDLFMGGGGGKRASLNM